MADLDDAYANRAYIPDAEAFIEAWPRKAAAFRDSVRAELGISYGPGERQAFDLFKPEGEAKGCVIFIHGGYWLALHRHDWSHLAAGALARGWAVAMPSYDLCPDVRIADITAQIARAVAQIATKVAGPISITGHSAGGHLSARMMAPGMLPPGVIARVQACVPISPLSDLEPFLRTSMNEQFKLDAEAARAESPKYQPAPAVPVSVWVGGDERPVFLDQTRWLVDAWECEEVIVPGKHHFDIIDALEDPDSDLVAKLVG